MNKDGGDNRDRTDDLLNAIQALSQLSYIPEIARDNMLSLFFCQSQNFVKRLIVQKTTSFEIQ